MKKSYTIILIFIIEILLFTGCSLLIAGKHNKDAISTLLPSNEITPTLAPKSADEVTPTTIPQPTAKPVNIITQPPTATPTPKPEVTSAPIPTVLPTPQPDQTDYENTAEKILKNMTLEEKIGQLFFVRCRNDQAASDIKTYHLGGYILFADDFDGKSKEEMQEIIKGYQDLSEIPMLIGVDEEGGTVNRISKFPQFRAVPFYSPQDLFKEGGFDLIKSDTIEKAKLLKNLGINVNLAPVCDVSTNPADFIYSRSFGKDAAETAEYVKTVVTEMKSQGIGSTLKHFPGYGNNVDTHTGIAIDNRSLQSFEKSDFLPFQAGIGAGAGSILVSHNIVKSMDKNFPASLSPAVHKILRDDMGFNGVIMTDDLSMDAIKEYTGDKEAAVLAIEAGNDLLIASNFDVQIPAVIAAVNDNTISKKRIDESVLRVLEWKLSLGIISQ